MIEINRNPTRRQLRQFAGILFPAFCATVGLIAFKGLDTPTWAFAIWTFGLVSMALGLAIPAVAKLLFLGLSYATLPIGWVLSHVVLMIIYYLLMTPIGFIYRRLTRDRLRRGIDRSRKSYWRPRPGDVPTSRYFRQY